MADFILLTTPELEAHLEELNANATPEAGAAISAHLAWVERLAREAGVDLGQQIGFFPFDGIPGVR